MYKEKISINKSAELFYELACRSFAASWNMFMEVNGDGDVDDYLDDPGFMSLFIIHVINHIQNNFELVAAMLVGYSEGFRK
ncbi:hypothetical protein [Pectobacterium parmentieri]|uniref:hypothetical protein n=1 Tax=Pectobacterium parmentieri TaxID=1905730 RepID=UPI0018E0061C|nr:hypothetical protein [Pectobacterium parmentieri]MBI0552692.1 hypothetical protein [Pectobacterium parmentieri]MBI0561714.1 hypothetical protein [Pectobacterium parmentieri]MBI0566000.1 hypothetical protein [Pectobacterium parmentieri]